MTLASERIDLAVHLALCLLHDIFWPMVGLLRMLLFFMTMLRRLCVYSLRDNVCKFS